MFRTASARAGSRWRIASRTAAASRCDSSRRRGSPSVTAGRRLASMRRRHRRSGLRVARPRTPRGSPRRPGRRCCSSPRPARRTPTVLRGAPPRGRPCPYRAGPADSPSVSLAERPDVFTSRNPASRRAAAGPSSGLSTSCRGLDDAARAAHWAAPHRAQQARRRGRQSASRNKTASSSGGRGRQLAEGPAQRVSLAAVAALALEDGRAGRVGQLGGAVAAVVGDDDDLALAVSPCAGPRRARRR